VSLIHVAVWQAEKYFSGRTLSLLGRLPENGKGFSLSGETNYKIKGCGGIITLGFFLDRVSLLRVSCGRSSDILFHYRASSRKMCLCGIILMMVSNCRAALAINSSSDIAYGVENRNAGFKKSGEVISSKRGSPA